MDRPEQAFVFDCVQSIKDQIPDERRYVIYPMAFRGMIEEFRDD